MKMIDVVARLWKGTCKKRTLHVYFEVINSLGWDDRGRFLIVFTKRQDVLVILTMDYSSNITLSTYFVALKEDVNLKYVVKCSDNDCVTS